MRQQSDEMVRRMFAVVTWNSSEKWDGRQSDEIWPAESSLGMLFSLAWLPESSKESRVMIVRGEGVQSLTRRRSNKWQGCTQTLPDESRGGFHPTPTHAYGTLFVRVHCANCMHALLDVDSDRGAD